MKRCVVCGNNLPVGSRSDRRTCSARCRVALSRRLNEACLGDPSHQHHVHDDDPLLTLRIPKSIWYDALDPLNTARAAEHGFPHPSRFSARYAEYEVEPAIAAEMVRAIDRLGSVYLSDPNTRADGRRYKQWAEREPHDA